MKTARLKRNTNIQKEMKNMIRTAKRKFEKGTAAKAASLRTRSKRRRAGPQWDL